MSNRCKSGNGFQKKRKLSELVICGWIPAVYIFVLGTSIAVIYLLSSWDYAKPLNSLPNLILLPFGLLYIKGLYSFIPQCVNAEKNSKGISVNCIIAILTIVITIVQITAANKYYFRTDWDVRNVTNAAMEHAQRMPMERWGKYFSKYPNNLLLVFIYSQVIRFFSFLPLNDPYFSLIIFQCDLYGVTAFLTYIVAEKLTNNRRLSILSWAVYFFLVWLSPWVTIPYSDSTGLFLPITIFVLYLWNFPKIKVIDFRWLSLGILTVIGYNIKPQVVIMVIAAVIVSVVKWLGDAKEREWILTAVKKTTNCFAGIALAFVLVEMAIGSLGIPLDKEKEIGMTSYVMMALNTDTKGVFNESDRNMSINIETREERRNTEIQIIKERIKEMGFSGILKQAIYKTLTNYNDGTFTWGKEGTFYYEVPKADDSSFSQLLRSLYYNRNYLGTQHSAWMNFTHSIWLAVLCLALFAVIKRDPFCAVLMLSIIGLTVFETLFEARARYFFTYAPIFILLAIQGVSAFGKNAEHRE